MRFYHGTRRKLPLDTVLQARVKAANAFESLIESLRPDNAHSRLSSFFLADKPDLVEYVGPAQRYIYEVVPNEVPTKVSFGWIEDLPGCSFTTGKCKNSIVQQWWPTIEEQVALYWKGKPTPYGFEYLSPTITVKKLVRRGIMK